MMCFIDSSIIKYLLNYQRLLKNQLYIVILSRNTQIHCSKKIATTASTISAAEIKFAYCDKSWILNLITWRYFAYYNFTVLTRLFPPTHIK